MSSLANDDEITLRERNPSSRIDPHSPIRGLCEIVSGITHKSFFERAEQRMA
jgi:hypothetical protein